MPEKTKTTGWTLAAVITAAAFIWWLLVLLIHPFHSIPAAQTAYTTKSNADGPPKPDGFWTIKIGDILSLVILLVQAAIFAFQAWIFKGQRDIQTRQIEMLPVLERAYVFIDVRAGDPTLTTPAHAGFVNCQIRVKFTNTGKSAAMITVINADFDTRMRSAPVALTRAPGSNRPIPPGFFIKAGGDFEITVVRTLPEVEMAWLDGVHDTIFCSGQIDYRDIFGDGHQTGFCWQLIFDRDEGQRFVISPDTPLNFFT